MSNPVERLNTALSGRYTIERELGEGGMATVYLAKDIKHNRNVALKVLKPELAAVVGAERFLTEIETTANLQHPHILPLFDSGEADSFLFYVMPYIEGETLGARMKREKQLPVDEAVAVATSVANAMQAAHEQGIVHRDIKPGNILLSRGQPLVADFGIALAVGAGGARMTETGLSVGTPFYMSPEQATGDSAIGPSADIYALACVLFEMLVGEPPFLGNTAQAVLGKIIQGLPVSATAVRRSVPANVDAAIRKGLEKLPADRFADADAFATALNDPGFRHGEVAESATGVADGPWKRRSFAASAVAVLATTLWASSLMRPTADTFDFELAIQNPQGQEFVDRELLDISPDGSFMVYQGPMAGGVTQLWLRRFDELTGRPIVGAEGAYNPEISPDGSMILFTAVSGGALKLVTVPTGGGVPQDVGIGMVNFGTWGPDGAIYGVHSSGGLAMVSRAGGATEVVLEYAIGQGGWRHPRLLPDGSGLVFASRVGPADPQIRGLRFETGETMLIAVGDDPVVTSTGHLLYVSEERQLVAVEFDSGSMETVGAAVPLLDDLLRSVEWDGHYSVASETGTLLYRTGAGTGRLQPVWVDRNGATVAIDDEWRGLYDSPALSPDGTQLAVDSAGAFICVKRLPSGPCQRLTFDGTTNHRPVWSPDGRSIVFASNTAGDERFDLDLYQVRSDGSNDPELVWDARAGTAQAVWTPEGDALIYRTTVSAASTRTERGAGDGDLFWFRLGVDSVATTYRATEAQERSPDLSPDGRWLAYTTNRSGRDEVVIRPFPSGDALVQVSTTGGSGPLWSESGDEIFFVSAGGAFVAAGISVVSDAVQVGKLVELFQVDLRFSLDVNHRSYDVAADGERFVMIEFTRGEGADRRELVLVENWLRRLVERVRN